MKFPRGVVFLTAAVLAAVAMGVVVACRTTPTPAPAPPTLYERVGGAPGMDRLTTTFVHLLVTDSALAPRFTRTDTAAFARTLAAFLCNATRGGCTYTGRSMRDAHAGMGVTTEEFNGFMTDFLNAMAVTRVDSAAQQEMVSLLSGMQGDVVGR